MYTHRWCLTTMLAETRPRKTIWRGAPPSGAIRLPAQPAPSCPARVPYPFSIAHIYMLGRQGHIVPRGAYKWRKVNHGYTEFLVRQTLQCSSLHGRRTPLPRAPQQPQGGGHPRHRAPPTRACARPCSVMHARPEVRALATGAGLRVPVPVPVPDLVPVTLGPHGPRPI